MLKMLITDARPQYRCCHGFAHQLVISSKQHAGLSTTIIAPLFVQKGEYVSPAKSHHKPLLSVYFVIGLDPSLSVPVSQ